MLLEILVKMQEEVLLIKLRKVRKLNYVLPGRRNVIYIASSLLRKLHDRGDMSACFLQT